MTEEAAQELAEKCEAEIVQVIGTRFILFKRNPKKLSLSNLETKAATLSSEIKEYSIKYQLLSLEDILK